MFLNLLSNVVQSRFYWAAAVTFEDADVVGIDGIGRPDAKHRACGQEALVDELFKHLLRVIKKTARSISDHRIGQNLGIFTHQVPRNKKGCPIDIGQ